MFDTGGRCAEKAIPATLYSPSMQPASLMPKDTHCEICSHVNQNEILSLCMGFSACLPAFLCNLKVKSPFCPYQHPQIQLPQPLPQGLSLLQLLPLMDRLRLRPVHLRPYINALPVCGMPL